MNLHMQVQALGSVPHVHAGYRWQTGAVPLQHPLSISTTRVPITPASSFVSSTYIPSGYAPSAPLPASAAVKLTQPLQTPLTHRGHYVAQPKPFPVASNVIPAPRQASAVSASGPVAIAEPQLSDDDALASWDDLTERCKEEIRRLQSSGVEVDLAGIALGDLENGTTNPFAKTRLFGRPPSDVRITLYRDTNGWCGFCQKVWIYMEEKRLPYHLEKVNLGCYGEKPAWIKKLNPKGLVPIVVLDGQPILESNEIMKKLESLFPEPSLVDTSAGGLRRMESLYNLSTKVTWAVLSTLSGRESIDQLELLLDEFSRELQVCPGPYLMSKFTVADIHFIPFMERGRACLMYSKGLNICADQRWKAVAEWFRALEARPAYVGTQSDFFNLAHFMPPQVGPFKMEPPSAPYLAAIDGTDGSWSLPLPSLFLETIPSSPAGALLAALKTAVNHERLVRFGQRTGAQDYPEAVDAALRHVVLELLGEGCLPSRRFFGKAEQRQAAAHACRYIRDRVGVPRDMRLDAARHLRAALNAVLACLGFDPLVKDLVPAFTSTLTYTPAGSKPADDLRSLLQR
eukprot:TRINITY_DN38744_c0_g1_i1.p1 TRINITY_DN38744_c0_g1~~TRINITY_DN38744_c0_g1_i1.p1  ORF type:complete len:590 (-),score=70.48 TRINITY_DN38744_c0_g1_i1:237-1949(-)